MGAALDRSVRWALVAALASLAIVLLGAGIAKAAVYPAGGSGFNGGPEGWTSPDPATCNIPLGGICSATSGYEGAAGNPAGSLALNTNIVINALGLIKSNGSFASPNFIATEGGSATLSLQRQVTSSSLVDLTPSATYTVTLIDRTTGVSSTVITDTVAAEDSFAGKDGAAKLVAGHTYAIAIAAETSSSLANLALLGGSTSLRFDNIALTVGTTGGGGGGGGAGGGGAGGANNNSSTITNRELRSLMQRNGLVGAARLKGKRLFVKAKCPAKVGRACRVTVQGMLKKGKPATTRRTAKIARGKAKQLVLKVKPKLKARVAKKKRLLFKQNVKAGPAKATVYKRMKLIKRR